MSNLKQKRRRLSAAEAQAATDAFVAYLRRNGGFGMAVQYLRKATEQLTAPAPEVDFGIENDCEFANAVMQGGSLVASCDFCGTTYFATYNESDYADDDEDSGQSQLEELRKLARDPKNKYVEWGDVDSISHGMLDGREYVYACDCKAAAAYEQFVWNHRYSIADFLKKRAAEETSKAEVIERIAKSAGEVHDSA